MSERDPATVAARAAGPVAPDRLGAVVDGDRRLLDLLEPDEQPHHLLEGTIADVVRGQGEERSRSRRSAPPDGAVYAVLTDRRLLVIVSYGDSVSTEEAPLASLAGVTLHTAGTERRLQFDAGTVSYAVYPGDDAAACEAAVAYVREHADDAEGGQGTAPGDDDTDTDPLERLERLADLRERGALTDAEFEAKKAEFLEDI